MLRYRFSSNSTNLDLGLTQDSQNTIFSFFMDTAHRGCIFEKTFLEAKYVTIIVSCLAITLLIQQGRKLDLELALAQSRFGSLF